MSEMSESDATASGSAEAEITIGDGVEGGGEAGATSSTYGTCGLCGIVFPTTQHERLVHPEWYHGKRMNLLTRAGWSDDEMVLVAREENRLVEKGRIICGINSANIRVNQDLFRAFPERPADAITSTPH